MNRSCPTYASEKARNILTFYWNSFFSLKIAFIIPFPAFLGELTSYLRKTIFFLVQKKGIYTGVSLYASSHYANSLLCDHPKCTRYSFYARNIPYYAILCGCVCEVVAPVSEVGLAVRSDTLMRH